MSFCIPPQLSFYIEKFKNIQGRVQEKLAIHEMKVDTKSLCLLLQYARTTKEISFINWEIDEDGIIEIPENFEWSIKTLSFFGSNFNSNSSIASGENVFESVIKWISNTKISTSINSLLFPQNISQDCAKDLLEKYWIANWKVLG